MFMAAAVASVLAVPSVGSAQWPSPAAAGAVVAPPAVIEGLDASPIVPLEFSRAWLARAADVQRNRAELLAAGELHGMSPAELAERGAALTGTLRVPVIPVSYADVSVPFPEHVLTERLFAPGRGDTLSYAGYWEEVSGGLLRVEGQVMPWVRLPKRARHYLPPEQYGWSQFGRMGELWTQVVEAAARSLDLGSFDNDGPDGIPNSGDDDGFVDFLVIVYATDCRSDWRAGSIWPHRGAMPPVETGQPSASGGTIKAADYVILPAVEPGTCRPMDIGVLAHETGHALGLPDLYDYDGTSQGIGAWGLMGTGSQSLPHSPAHLSAWAKEQLGWVQVDRLESDTAGLSIPPVASSGRVFRHDLKRDGGEYLLLENRQPQGSDRALPGHGLLVWRVDGEQAELGAWNGDEQRPAVSLLQADGFDDLMRGAPADLGDPFPGASRRTSLIVNGDRPFELSEIRLDGETVVANVRIGHTSPALVATPEAVRFSTTADHRPVARRVSVRAVAGATSDWKLAPIVAPWLEAAREGDALVLQADATGLAPGVYQDTVRFAADEGDAGGKVIVELVVVPTGQPEVIASRLPWSWGLSAEDGRPIMASYAWDPLRIRPQPRLLQLQPGDTHPETLVRLPAEALYAPVPAGYGAVHVLARAQGENYVYRVEADGRARVIADRIGDAPAYGIARLPDQSLVVADWDGKVHRVTPDGAVEPWGDLGTHVYQISTDSRGTLYAATYDGDVIRVDPAGSSTLLRTGFRRGHLVAVAADEDGSVYVAERGGDGRVLRISPDGRRTTVARVPGAHFYGLAVDSGFLYALDLRSTNLLRIGLPAGSGGVPAD